MLAQHEARVMCDAGLATFAYQTNMCDNVFVQ